MYLSVTFICSFKRFQRRNLKLWEYVFTTVTSYVDLYFEGSRVLIIFNNTICVK